MRFWISVFSGVRKRRKKELVEKEK